MWQKERRGEKPERNIEPRTIAGVCGEGGGGIYKDNRTVGSKPPPASQSENTEAWN